MVTIGQKLAKATVKPDVYNNNEYKNEQKPPRATGFSNTQRPPPTGFNNEQRSPLATSVFNKGYNYDQRPSVFNNEYGNEGQRPKKSIYTKKASIL